MKNIILALAMVATIGLPLVSHSGEHELEIKGVWIGMTQDQFIEKLGSTPVPKGGMTIAGASNIYPVDPIFKNDKLQSFIFFFSSSEYENVLSAIQSKYKTRCEKGSVSNAFGVKLEQKDCFVEKKQGVIRVIKYIHDVKTSAVDFSSNEHYNDLMKDKRKKNSDI